MGDRIVDLDPNHAVSGNRSRFSQGDVEIRLDDEWRRAPGGNRFLMSTLAAPWLAVRRLRPPLPPAVGLPSREFATLSNQSDTEKEASDE